jgi:hypothetical protein
MFPQNASLFSIGKNGLSSTKYSAQIATRYQHKCCNYTNTFLRLYHQSSLECFCKQQVFVPCGRVKKFKNFWLWYCTHICQWAYHFWKHHCRFSHRWHIKNFGDCLLFVYYLSYDLLNCIQNLHSPNSENNKIHKTKQILLSFMSSVYWISAHERTNLWPHFSYMITHAQTWRKTQVMLSAHWKVHRLSDSIM